MKDQMITENLSVDEALRAVWSCLSESAPAGKPAGEETKENRKK